MSQIAVWYMMVLRPGLFLRNSGGRNFFFLILTNTNALGWLTLILHFVSYESPVTIAMPWSSLYLDDLKSLKDLYVYYPKGEKKTSWNPPLSTPPFKYVLRGCWTCMKLHMYEAERCLLLLCMLRHFYPYFTTSCFPFVISEDAYAWIFHKSRFLLFLM